MRVKQRSEHRNVYINQRLNEEAEAEDDEEEKKLHFEVNFDQCFFIKCLN